MPNPIEFEIFESRLTGFGFRPVSSAEVGRDILKFGLKPPRQRSGKEAGYVYSDNGLDVYVWTTWLRDEGEAREEDAGWVLIVGDDKILYSSHPIHRTKNFLDNLLNQARVARIRVRYRPKCPQCGEFMMVVHGRVLKSRYWYCGNKTQHPTRKFVVCNWDTPLPLGMKLYVKIARHKRAQYRQKLAEEGKVVTPAITTRKRW